MVKIKLHKQIKRNRRIVGYRQLLGWIGMPSVGNLAYTQQGIAKGPIANPKQFASRN